MAQVARLYSQHTGAPSRRVGLLLFPTITHVDVSLLPQASTVPMSASSLTSPTSPTSASSTASRGGFTDYDSLFSHDWQPAPGKQGPDTYSDLAAAKVDAEERKRQRENKIAMEQREAEIERRERELKRKQEMAAIEARRQKEAAEEAERRRQMKEDMKNKPAAKAQPKRPKFEFEKEKPQIMVAVASALQSANNLVNSCRVSRRSVTPHAICHTSWSGQADIAALEQGARKRH